MDPRSSVRRLALARVVSVTGSWAGGLALPFVLYQQTRSGVWVAASWLITFGITGLMAPFGGLLADRIDRRRLMIGSDLAGAGFWGLLSLAHNPILMLTLAFLATLSAQPFWAASGAAVPNLVGEDELGWANSTLGVAGGTAAVAGPAIGGALIALFGAHAVFALNAGSFVFSGALIVTIRGRFSAERTDDLDEREPRAWLAGFRFIRAERVLAALAVVWTFQYFAIDAALVADPPLVRLFAAGAIGYGAMNSGWGLGAIAGSFLGRRLSRRTWGRAVAAGSVVTAVCYLAVSLTPVFWPIVALMAAVALPPGEHGRVLGRRLSRQRAGTAGRLPVGRARGGGLVPVPSASSRKTDRGGAEGLVTRRLPRCLAPCLRSGNTSRNGRSLAGCASNLERSP